MARKNNKKERSGKDGATDSDFVPDTDALSSGEDTDTSKISSRTRRSEKNKKEKKQPTSTQTTIPETLQRPSRTPDKQKEHNRSQSRSQTPRSKHSIKALTSELKKQMNILLQNTYISTDEDMRAAIELCKTISRKISDVNQEIMTSHLQLVTINTQQERRIDELNEQINLMMQRIPTAADIAQVVHEEINEHQKSIHKSTKEIQALHKNIQTTHKRIEDTLTMAQQQTSPSTPTEDTQTPASPIASQPTSKKPSYSQITSNNTNRTLVVRSATNRTTSGATLWDTLKKTQLTLPTSSIEQITPRNNHLEIICRTSQEKDTIQRHIQQHPTLQKELTAVTKATQKQLVILLGVPDSTTEEHIKEHITSKFHIKQDDQQLRPLNNRTPDHKNWTALLPATLATQLIKTGLILGLHRIRVRPFTSVKRCTYCQQYGHSQAQCNNPATCVNCGLHHTDSNCVKEPHCINCQAANSKNNTRNDTKHPANANTCPTYRTYYEKERQRLDALYPQATQTRPQPRQDTLHQQEQTAPPNNQHPPPRLRHETTQQEELPRPAHRTIHPTSRPQRIPNNYHQDPYPGDAYPYAEAHHQRPSSYPPPWHYSSSNPRQLEHQHWQDYPPQRWNWQAGDYTGNSFQPFAPLLPTPFY